MGKYMRKAKATREVAVMEVSQSSLGIITRAKTLALQKTTSSTSYLQLRNRRLEKPTFVFTTEPKKTKEKPTTEKESISTSILENEASFGENVCEIDGRERNIRETTPSSLIRDSHNVETPGSTTRPTNSTAANRRIRNAAHNNIPTSLEIEEFFAGLEQQQQRIFIEKYNFDPINDSPLPGLYEWVRLDP
ncbi:cyclin-dependent kinase inhibitor 4-like [Tasmannia lanceolata]|uniref:cyclin-dependent kinase inhibitor 4-like n=1 Tax=Tasmannia lanceolata TaxID=3420 RepID=UPI004062A943